MYYLVFLLFNIDQDNILNLLQRSPETKRQRVNTTNVKRSKSSENDIMYRKSARNLL